MRIPCILIALSLLPAAGCNSQAWSLFLRQKADWHEQRAAEQRLALEEAEFCRQVERSECERDRREFRDQYEEQVRTKLGIDLEQQIQLGQLQVDTGKLKQLLDDREKEYTERMKIYESLKEEEREDQRKQLLAAAQEWRRQKYATPGAANGECGCVTQLPDCAQPFMAPFKEMRAPIRQPVLPTEIPLMLPVTLSMNMERAQLQETSVHRLPLKEACEPCDKCTGTHRCPRCKGCLKCNECTCTPSCGVLPPSGGPGEPATVPGYEAEEPDVHQMGYFRTRPAGGGGAAPVMLDRIEP